MKPHETLSQEEIDALLSAVKSGAVAVSPGADRADAKAVIYNFRRPSRVSKEQIRALQILHDDFAKLTAASLGGMLRGVADLELEAVEQISYSEYVLAIANPTCAFVFNMEPLKGGAVLELSPHVASVMIHRLLGGHGFEVAPHREFTEIERAVVERIGLRTMVDLQQAWQQVGAFVFRILHLETNPQFIQVTSPNEVILVATFRLKIGPLTGGLSVGYPYLLLESIMSRLGGQRWVSPSASGPAPEVRNFLLKEMSQSPLTLRAFLGGTHLTVRELLELKPGQLLPLETKPEDSVRVEINSVPTFTGRPGTHRKHLAVEVLGRVDERNES
ncbi:MAG: flagellar motor switch protein FliM [Candidatus Rokubacteria bacterium]|nr:flagellar motor switch protein FliM [Candidatus Rokubacteria bacterium]